MTAYTPQTEMTRILLRLLALIGKGTLGLTAAQYERLRRGVLHEHSSPISMFVNHGNHEAAVDHAV